MTDHAGAGSGGNSQSSAPSGGSYPAQTSPVSQPAAPPIVNERSCGFSPAMEQRRQAEQGQQGQDGERSGEPQTIKIGDVEYTTDQVNDALRFRSEQDIRARSLPQSADGYEVKLPDNFELPHGVKWEFDRNSPELKNFQRLAHARGLDQEAFSEALGIYAANRIGEQQRLSVARDAELSRLGSAANNRIAAVETWLKSQVGAKANVIINQMKNFPVASMVEMFEHLARNASSQGGASFSQSHRHEPDNTGSIAGYESMSFSQKRAAQDAQAGRPVHGPRASGGR